MSQDPNKQPIRSAVCHVCGRVVLVHENGDLVIHRVNMNTNEVCKGSNTPAKRST
jgi:hypothetical protein